jgi:acyl carrier protein
MTLPQRGVASNPQALENVVIDLVTSTLSRKPGNIKPDDPLFSSQIGFDSFSLMEFVLRLEDTFGISIPDEDLDPDIFYSIKTVVAYLQIRLEQAN